MTEQRSLKQMVRARMLETGESYAKARRRILAQHQEIESVPAGDKIQNVMDHALVQMHQSRHSQEVQAAAVLRWRERGLIREVSREAVTRLAGREQPGLQTLQVSGPEAGRLLLGRVDAQLMAGEPGVSVLVIGPAGSGKTDSLIIPNLLAWEGPAVVIASKTAVEATRMQRGKRGPVYVFDPSAVMGGGEAASQYTVCGFSPLAQCEEADSLYPDQSRVSWNACWRSAERCCAGLERGDASDWGYWAESAKRLIAPMFYAARLGGKTMAEVTKWVNQEDAGTPIGLIEEAAQNAGMSKQSNGQWVTPRETNGELKTAEVQVALESLVSIDKRPDKERGTVFTVCQGLFSIYYEATVRSTWDMAPIDVERFIQGRGTLYLVVPDGGGERFAGLYLAMLDFLVEKTYAMAAKDARGRLDPRLGLFLDATAKYCPTQKLYTLADQARSYGITVMATVAEIAQLRKRFGDRMQDLIVHGFKAKIIMAGITDPEEADYLCEIFNQESGVHSNFYRLRPELVRSLKPGEALLWYPKLLSPATPPMLAYRLLGPVRLQLQPWFTPTAGGDNQEQEVVEGRKSVELRRA